MSLHLVPTDAGWLDDTGLKASILDNFKSRVEAEVKELGGHGDVRVHQEGDAIVVDIAGKDVAREKGSPPHQMTARVGDTIPIKTPSGTIFRKVTPLSIAMGKWNRRQSEPGGQVKAAVQKVMANSLTPILNTKRQLESKQTPLLRDILGIPRNR